MDTNHALIKLVSVLQDGVITIDKTHSISFANDSAINLLGINRERLIGKKFEETVNLQVEARRISLPEDSQQVVHQEAIMSRSDRSIIEVNFSLISTDECTFVIFHDKSIDKKIDQAKTEFISLVSHQLRTPINIISWYIDKLSNNKKGSLNDFQTEYLNQISSSNKRLVELVRSIVNVSRTDLSRIVPKNESVDVTKLVRERLGIAQSKYNNNFVLECNDESILVENSDHTLLGSVIDNLLSNSANYTLNQSDIVVGINKVGSDTILDNGDLVGDGVLITVTDDGLGIPDQEKHLVFTKLYRGSNVKALEVSGIGLGLYTAKAFIDVLGGKIWFTSELRNGSKFYVYIPLRLSAIIRPNEGA